ncbi:MAG: hypothetical protein ACOYUZ_03710 [Patescibacteria group bacterium]
MHYDDEQDIKDALQQAQDAVDELNDAVAELESLSTSGDSN